jgi:hypothetical protein
MAFENERSIYRFMQGFGESLIAEITANEAFTQVCDNGNHPAWILGHLALVADRMATTLGAAPALDHDEWGKLFGLGSEPVGDGLGYPAWDELVAAWKAGHARLDAAATDPDEAILQRPNPNERTRPALPTFGHLLTFILTGHESMHLGQLSTWRRVQGHAPLF